MNMEVAHHFVDQLAKVLELVGVATILSGVVLSGVAFVRNVRSSHDWRAAYERFRSNLGRGILLGLELLVGADIISTITSPLTVDSVSLLGGIIVIRTFLSFFSGDGNRGVLALAALARQHRR